MNNSATSSHQSNYNFRILLKFLKLRKQAFTGTNSNDPCREKEVLHVGPMLADPDHFDVDPGPQIGMRRIQILKFKMMRTRTLKFEMMRICNISIISRRVRILKFWNNSVPDLS